jgi:hypothetical protein
MYKYYSIDSYEKAESPEYDLCPQCDDIGKVQPPAGVSCDYCHRWKEAI